MQHTARRLTGSIGRAAAHGRTTSQGTRRKLSSAVPENEAAPSHPIVASRKLLSSSVSGINARQATQITSGPAGNGKTSWGYESRDALGRRFVGSGFECAATAEAEVAKVRQQVLPANGLLRSLPVSELVEVGRTGTRKGAKSKVEGLFKSLDKKSFSTRMRHRMSPQGVEELRQAWHGRDADAHEAAQVVAARVAYAMPPALRQSLYALMESAIQSPYQNAASLRAIVREWVLPDASDPSGTVLRQHLAPFLGLSSADLEQLLRTDVRHARTIQLQYLFEEPTSRNHAKPSEKFQPVLTLPPPEVSTVMMEHAAETAVLFDRATDLGADMEVIILAKAQGAYALQQSGAFDVLAQFPNQTVLESPDSVVAAMADALIADPAALDQFTRHCPLDIGGGHGGGAVVSAEAWSDLYNAIGFLVNVHSVPGSMKRTNAQVMMEARARGFKDATDMKRCGGVVWAMTHLRGMEMALSDAAPIMEHVKPAFASQARAFGEHLAHVANWRARHTYFENLHNHATGLVLGGGAKEGSNGNAAVKTSSFRAIHEDLYALIGGQEAPKVSRLLAPLFPIESQAEELRSVTQLAEQQSSLPADELWNVAQEKWANAEGNVGRHHVIRTKVTNNYKIKTQPMVAGFPTAQKRGNTFWFLGANGKYYDLENSTRTWYEDLGQVGTLQGEAELLLSFRTLLGVAHDPAQLIRLHDLAKPANAAHAGAFALAATSALRSEGIPVGALIARIKHVWNVPQSDEQGLYIPRGGLVQPNPLALPMTVQAGHDVVNRALPVAKWKRLAALSVHSSAFVVPEVLLQADGIVAEALDVGEGEATNASSGETTPAAAHVSKWERDLLIGRMSHGGSLPSTSGVSTTEGGAEAWVSRTVGVEYVPECVSEQQLRGFLESTYGRVENLVMFKHNTMRQVDARKQVRSEMFDMFEPSSSGRFVYQEYQDDSRKAPQRQVSDQIVASALQSRDKCNNDTNDHIGTVDGADAETGGDGGAGVGAARVSSSTPEVQRARFADLQLVAMHSNHKALALVDNLSPRAAGSHTRGGRKNKAHKPDKALATRLVGLLNSTLEVRQLVSLLSPTVEMYEMTESACDANWHKFVGAMVSLVRAYRVSTGELSATTTVEGDNNDIQELVEAALTNPVDDESLLNLRCDNWFLCSASKAWLSDALALVGVEDYAAQQAIMNRIAPDWVAVVAMARERLVVEEFLRVKMGQLDELLENQDKAMEAAYEEIEGNSSSSSSSDDAGSRSNADAAMASAGSDVDAAAGVTLGTDSPAVAAMVGTTTTPLAGTNMSLSSPPSPPQTPMQRAGGVDNVDNDDVDDEDDGFMTLDPIIPKSSSASGGGVDTVSMNDDNDSSSSSRDSHDAGAEAIREQLSVWGDRVLRRKLRDRLASAFERKRVIGNAAGMGQAAVMPDSVDVDLGTHAIVTFANKTAKQHFAKSEALRIFGVRYGVPNAQLFAPEQMKRAHVLEEDMQYFMMRVHPIEERTSLRITGLPGTIDVNDALAIARHHCASVGIDPAAIRVIGKTNKSVVVRCSTFEDTWRLYHGLHGAVMSGVPVVVSLDFGNGFANKKLRFPKSRTGSKIGAKEVEVVEEEEEDEAKELEEHNNDVDDEEDDDDDEL